MINHRRKGATLALVVAVIFCLSLIGIGMFAMTKLFGGARELSMLTDSGTLNLGKRMGVVGVPLQTNPQKFQYHFSAGFIGAGSWTKSKAQNVQLQNGVEGSNFSALADSNGNISLQNYNRVIAQTMLVAFNAQGEGTMAAASNAQSLYDYVQRNNTSLSERLLAKLSDPTVSSPIFQNTGMANSLRMLGPASTPTFINNQYGVAYTDPGGCTNVWIDPTILPSGITMPAAAVSSTNGPTNQPYLTGYTDIDAGPITLQGTPVYPGCQPHLIAQRDFDGSLTSPASLGYVAPNSFGAYASANDTLSSNTVMNRSQSVVGLLNSGYPAAIPGGYVVLSTVAGLGGSFSTVVNSLNAADQSALIAQIVQRIRQIKPDLSIDQAQTFLRQVNINSDPSKPTYVYLYPDPSSPLYSTWHTNLLAAGVPDGTPNQLFASTVQPPTFPQGMDQTFGMYPDGIQQNYNGWWDFEWNPSSGFGNFLGALTIP